MDEIDKELQEACNDTFRKLLEESEPLDAEFQKILDDNDWDLLEES